MAGALAGGGSGGGGEAGEGAEVAPTGAPSVVAVRVLVAGVVSSRTGLWMYDLAVTQLVQERVEQEHLGGWQISYICVLGGRASLGWCVNWK